MIKKKFVAVLAGALFAITIAGCSDSNADSENESAVESEISEAVQSVEGEENTEEQNAERDMNFETGEGLPTFNELSDRFKQVAGMTLEENKNGSIAIYGYRTGDEIGEILFGGEGDDYDMMLIIDKKAGDKEEGEAVYCLKNALASMLRVLNDDVDYPFDDAMSIIEYGTQSPYLYGMQEYLVGNIDNGASYAIKITSIG